MVFATVEGVAPSVEGVVQGDAAILVIGAIRQAAAASAKMGVITSPAVLLVPTAAKVEPAARRAIIVYKGVAAPTVRSAAGIVESVLMLATILVLMTISAVRLEPPATETARICAVVAAQAVVAGVVVDVVEVAAQPPRPDLRQALPALQILILLTSLTLPPHLLPFRHLHQGLLRALSLLVRLLLRVKLLWYMESKTTESPGVARVGQPLPPAALRVQGELTLQCNRSLSSLTPRHRFISTLIA